MDPMASIPVVVTAPATVASVNVARPLDSNGARAGSGILDYLVIAPAAAEPLFLSIWAGVDVPYAAATRRDVIPIKDSQNIVPIGQSYPTGCTIRISTGNDGTGNPAAAKICSFSWV